MRRLMIAWWDIARVVSYRLGRYDWADNCDDRAFRLERKLRSKV
jgi:hypothetical protein